MRTPKTTTWRKKTDRHDATDETGYAALIVAIIRQAVEDYTTASRMVKGEIKHACGISDPFNTLTEVEKFFKSDWYAELCDIPAERILKKLKETNR